MTEEQAAYDYGYSAAHRGAEIVANPYDPNEQEEQYWAWRKGWKDYHLVY